MPVNRFLLCSVATYCKKKKKKKKGKGHFVEAQKFYPDCKARGLFEYIPRAIQASS